MREQETMNLGDLENTLDKEEALYYYSRLRSPVYHGIVNKFLMDIYSDYSVPETVSMTNSKRRFGLSPSLQTNQSMIRVVLSCRSSSRLWLWSDGL
ncbi:hypothetical protein CRG98_050415 [Punica granatum]|uniref:Uncharacterized protein n=1 Tax=Punica granatum TaxID=22663 RepID=A0A2I0GBL8_PUNGR|nr:hypothetical protein CRG98_050415 [Punica granatum]